jgi:hypothetical protein
MLAPTRYLVAELNRRARAHRLLSAPTPEPDVALADENRASAGEVIITRHNDRRLRTSAFDWVKNGDRWTVLATHRDGGLLVQHGRTGRPIQLPASYVRDWVELGYATASQEPGTPNAVAATRHTTTISRDQQRPVASSVPPHTFGPSR